MSARVSRVEVPTAQPTRKLAKLVPLNPRRVRRSRILDNWLLVVMVLCSTVFAIGMARTFLP
jgi:hypothetical protein